MINTNHHPLLWTSGWDSTFRLLDLLHTTDLVIQPYYLYSIPRKSASMELQAIHQILLKIKERPEWRNRVEHPIIRLGDQYRWGGSHYDEAFQRLCQKLHIGMQYRYMAVFRDTEAVSGMELCLTSVEGGASEQLRKTLKAAEGVAGGWELSDEAEDDFKTLFGGYRFPLIHTSKVEMARQAKLKGFEDILELAWFCHTPIDRNPCGLCRPCQMTVSCGLGHRLGSAGMERYLAAKEKKDQVAV